MEMQIKKVDFRQQTHGKFGKTRIHFSFVGESVLDDLENRHSRPYNLLRKFIPEILEQAGLNSQLKARWSQYAGCKCPCSPGFILDENWGNVIYVTIGEKEEEKEGA